MKFSVSRTDGKEIPDSARFFVLRVDGGLNERAAEIAAVREYAGRADPEGAKAALDLLHGVGADGEEKLQPGPYSIFVLSDDGMWDQPIFVLDQPETEQNLSRWAEARFRGFWSCGLQEDTDAPEDVVASAPHYPGDA